METIFFVIPKGKDNYYFTQQKENAFRLIGFWLHNICFFKRLKTYLVNRLVISSTWVVMDMQDIRILNN